MYAVTAEEMREIDRAAVKDYLIPGDILMENAAVNMLYAVKQEWGSIAFKRAAVFCKGGNNGGDGAALARHLKCEGADAAVYFLGDISKASMSASENIKRAEKYGVEIIYIKDKPDIEKIRDRVIAADFIVDALIGTGLDRETDEFTAGIIAFINSLRKPVISADIPSGINSDTGAVMGAAVHADITVTFGLPKRGLAVFPGTGYAGKLISADISFPPELISKPRKSVIVTPEIASALAPSRPVNANKGDFGPVLIVGGAPSFSGAVILAAMGALKAGAGVVNLLIPDSIYGAVKNGPPEAVTTSLKSGEDGMLCEENYELIMKFAQKAKTAIIGPGLGRGEVAFRLIRKIVENIEIPFVLDADGINAAVQDKKCLKKIKNDAILTPHMGEMSRLCGHETADIVNNRFEILEEFIDECNINVLLKDGRSLVADREKNFYINTTGNSGMATPGSGDVLSGVIGGFAAHSIPIVRAAIGANYIHGLSGDILADDKGPEGITAGEIAGNLYKALKKNKIPGGY